MWVMLGKSLVTCRPSRGCRTKLSSQHHTSIHTAVQNVPTNFTSVWLVQKIVCIPITWGISAWKCLLVQFEHHSVHKNRYFLPIHTYSQTNRLLWKCWMCEVLLPQGHGCVTIQVTQVNICTHIKHLSKHYFHCQWSINNRNQQAIQKKHFY